ncbi:MAG: SH3 domain-containing protein [Candidatus Promineifilaceae bacterium]
MADLVHLDHGHIGRSRNSAVQEAQFLDARLFLLHGLSLLSLITAVLIAVYALLRRLLPHLNLQGPALLEAVNWPPGLTMFRFLILFFLLLAVLLLLAGRRQIRGNISVQAPAGCPSCQEKELMRVSRTNWDRLITISGVRVARYQCRECQWNGRRVFVDAYNPLEYESAKNHANEFAGKQSDFTEINQGKADVAVVTRKPAEPAPIEARAAIEPAIETTVEAAAPVEKQEVDLEQIDEDSDMNLLNPGDRARIMTTFGVNLRSQPQFDALWVGLLGPETAVMINRSERKDDGTVWYHIESRRQSGWVTAASLEKLAANNHH